MSKYYVNIIVFKDGAEQILADKQRQDNFQAGAECWRVSDDTQLMEVLEWKCRRLQGVEHKAFKKIW